MRAARVRSCTIQEVQATVVPLRHARARMDPYEIANGLTIATYNLSGLLDLMCNSQRLADIRFPGEIRAGIESAALVARKALNDYARKL